VFESPPVPKPGDRLHVIAPAGPFNRTLFYRGLDVLARTFRVRWTSRVFHREGYLAGSATERALDLSAALRCAETRIVVCARGGVGSAELLDSLAALDAGPKWLAGFSDITALHAGLQRKGWMSIHGPNVTSLGVGNAAMRERFIQQLLHPLQARVLQLVPLVPGSVAGPLVGGNLTVLHDLCAANAWAPTQGSLLFIEETAEPPYRIHRMLTAMHRGGHLRSIQGVVVGQVTLSNAGPYRASAKQVITDLCLRWGLPAAWGLPSGHDPRENEPLTFGSVAQLTVGHDTAHIRLNVNP
jgi:muramoyltetrapeptide carboxypeptidase